MVKTMEELEAERVEPVKTRKVRRDAITGSLWYVTFAPEPKGLRQRLANWLVEVLTPEWALITESKSVAIPYSAEDIGEAFTERLQEYRETHGQSRSGENIMVLRFEE